jgi:YHS domain-containing protein
MEASGMKRPLYSLTAALLTALVVLTAGKAAGALEQQTIDLAQNPSDNGQNAAAQTSPQETKRTTARKVNVDGQGIILKGCDVISYFKQGKPVKGNPAIESTYQGATYLFSSSANKADFDSDPAKYAPQYGAFCSYGVVEGVLADLDTPRAYVLYKGKLYLCGNEGALKAFKTNIDSNIGQADTNWLHLTRP